MQKQQSQREQAQKNANDSQLEDGSSGGEGTLAKNVAAASRANNTASSGALPEAVEANVPERVEKVERQLNSTYLGELDQTMDLETVKINESTPEFEVTDTRYTAMRLKCVFKLWPYVQEALNSPWSNIRSICYGLICSMLKIDVRDCNKYMPFSPEEENKTEENQHAKEFEEQDKELLEKNKFYQKLR